MNGEQSERDFLRLELSRVLDILQRYSARPENRSRRLSLAVTNVEQGILWFHDHIANDPLDSIALQDPR